MNSLAGHDSRAADAPPSIRELRRRNAELTEQVARLAEAVVARDNFLAMAAHELRNPMTPIIGRVQMLRRALGKPDVDPEATIASLDQIEWLIAHYLKRATTLLDISRITSGRLRLASEPVEVCKIARDVAESFRPLAEHAGADVSLDLPGDGVIVRGDRLAIEEIIDNLVSNAIKYGAGQRIRMSVDAVAESGVAHIRVRDGGPGIPPESQARIFERFERAVRPGGHSSGFGLGLWIVRHLSEAMGGGVEVASAPDAGSNFRVALPLHIRGNSL